MIDAHHHVWDLAVRDQDWITGPQMAVIRRSFAVGDLRPAARAAGVSATVVVQTVTVAGQVIKVGTTAPTLSFSGPGEIDLFGQSLPTHVQFLGPVRPRLQLTQITINSELTNFVLAEFRDETDRRLTGPWNRVHRAVSEALPPGSRAEVQLGVMCAVQ